MSEAYENTGLSHKIQFLILPRKIKKLGSKNNLKLRVEWYTESFNVNVPISQAGPSLRAANSVNHNFLLNSVHHLSIFSL